MRAELHSKPKQIAITLKPDNVDERVKLLNFFQMKTETIIVLDQNKNAPYGQIKMLKAAKVIF